VSNTDFIVHFFDKAEVEHFLEEKTMVYINGAANNLLASWKWAQLHIPYCLNMYHACV
jgi:hypothetical protein